jgi:acyl-CoA synthetase (AMP-forming)/AMP-acid ligase II
MLAKTKTLSQATRSQFTTLLDALTLQFDADERDAIIYVQTGQEPVRISRRRFRTAAHHCAIALKVLGIKPRDLVVIAHTQNLESIYAFWGALMAGAIPSMFPTMTEKLDPEIYMRNLAELVNLSAVRAVLTTDEFALILDDNVGCTVFGSSQLTSGAADGVTEPFQTSELDPDQTAFLQHSSGTTGLQKGVALSHRAVLNQLANYGDAIGLNGQDIVVSWLPLYHDMGLIAGFLLPLVQGIPLVLMSPFDWVRHPALLLRAIHEQQGTLCWLPNFAYNHSARRIRQRDGQGFSLASMRLFVNCSEPVRHDSHQQFLERFSANGLKPEMLSVSYAMAENTFGVTQTPQGMPAALDIINRHALEEQGIALPVPTDHPQAISKVSCGLPIAGTKIRVVSNKLNKLPERKVGEIAVKSNCMLTEYYNRPDLQPFHDGWFLTGDRGYIANGEVYIIGRSKDLIINAGKNIYPQDIESIVNELPAIHAGRAVVFGVPDPKEGTELIAVIAEVATVDPIERQQISKRIRQEVSRQSMVTVSYVQLVDPKWLIKTSSGKIARAANREKWLAQRKHR